MAVTIGILVMQLGEESKQDVFMLQYHLRVGNFEPQGWSVMLMSYPASCNLARQPMLGNIMLFIGPEGLIIPRKSPFSLSTTDHKEGYYDKVGIYPQLPANSLTAQNTLNLYPCSYVQHADMIMQADSILLLIKITSRFATM